MYKVISTFSGVGGSSLGYKLAGLDVIASVEFIDHQAHNYRLNHPTTKVYQEDIRKLQPKEILDDLGLKVGELDILDGSPPCAAFSTAGSREKAWGTVKKYSNTTQRVDDLFFEYIRFLNTMQPKVFIAENVSGLIKGVAKGYFKDIFEEFEACGYIVKAKKINAKYYNVPQSRERIIFIGVRKDLGIEPSYPVPNPKTIPIKDVLNIENDKSEFLTLRRGTECRLLYDNTIPGQTLAVAAKRILRKENSHFNHRRESFHKPCSTICQGTIQNYHPEIARSFTINELKRITSFPDDFKLEGTLAQQWEACGRTVPPNMMRAIAENVKKNILEVINV